MRSDVTAAPKRAVTILGHKTSVSIEEPFWNEVRAIASAQRVTVSKLVSRIDADREDANLSSAIRVFVLQHVRDRVNAPQEQPPLPAAQRAQPQPTLPQGVTIDR